MYIHRLLYYPKIISLHVPKVIFKKIFSAAHIYVNSHVIKISCKKSLSIRLFIELQP